MRQRHSIQQKTQTLSSSRLSNGFIQLSQDLNVITQKKTEKKKKNTRKNTSWENQGVTTLSLFLPQSVGRQYHTPLAISLLFNSVTLHKHRYCQIR